MSDQPNLIQVGTSMLQARRAAPPHPTGTGRVDHGALAQVLTAVAGRGVASLPDHRRELVAYRDQLEAIDPDDLSAHEALAYWINLYNAGALALAADALAAGQPTVLRVPGGFRRPWARVAHESLSLDDIEHGKTRRFGDPRIHGALVCGSVSCPTLRYEPYRGEQLDEQLDTQMRRFLATGGARLDTDRRELRLSRIFLWYGGDFTQPHRMPTWLPARRQHLARAVSVWLDPTDAGWIARNRPRVAFASYDWTLGCSIA